MSITEAIQTICNSNNVLKEAAKISLKENKLYPLAKEIKDYYSESESSKNQLIKMYGEECVKTIVDYVEIIDDALSSQHYIVKNYKTNLN